MDTKRFASCRWCGKRLDRAPLLAEAQAHEPYYRGGNGVAVAVCAECHEGAIYAAREQPVVCPDAKS